MSKSPPKPHHKPKPSGRMPLFNQKPVDIAQLGKRFSALYASGNYIDAYQIITQVLSAGGAKNVNVLADAASVCIRLERWQDAVNYANKSISIDPSRRLSWDALAHAHYMLGDFVQCGAAGKMALTIADQITQAVTIDPEFSPAAIVPFSKDSNKNAIAFCLFGNNSRYTETAVLNAALQAQIYPHWHCRYYIDDTVSATVVARLQREGARVIVVDDDLKKCPGPMWRFIAYDDPSLERIIFRDVDSVINTRESTAVEAWLNSDKAFHLMRDAGSHTELILAGLWGVCRGAIPPMHALLAHFLQSPINDAHFADQFFLKQYIWPYAKKSMLQHDSLFGFLDGKPFPAGEVSANFHVGMNEGACRITVKTALAAHTAVEWYIVNQDQQEVCRYPALVGANGDLAVNVPISYGEKINQNLYQVRFNAT